MYGASFVIVWQGIHIRQERRYTLEPLHLTSLGGGLRCEHARDICLIESFDKFLIAAFVHHDIPWFIARDDVNGTVYQ